MATSIDKHVVRPSDSYFFDTNVWLFIFAPLAQHSEIKQRKYSKLLSDIQSRKAVLWINSIVISEYINRVLRLEFNQWKDRNEFPEAEYKRDFRKTKDYKSSLNSVKQQVSDIMSVSVKKSDDFNSLDIGGILTMMDDATADYNDAIIIDMCNREKERNDIKLVTDDKDITNKSFPFQVITAHI